MDQSQLNKLLIKQNQWYYYRIGSPVDFSGKDLRGLYLENRYLFNVNFSDADLRNTNFQNAYLGYTNLRGANLIGANLKNAKLSGALIEGTKFSKFQIPQTKTLYVFKKLYGGEIAHLRIPRTARRTATPIGNKCRAERAFVLRIVDRQGKDVSKGESFHRGGFFYKVGETVSVPDYDGDIREECRPGIHFFMTEEEARAYR